MSFSFGVFTFINVWWVMLFIVLPFGVKTSGANATANSIEYAGAPKAPRWKKLLVINSFMSLLVTLLLALLIHYNAVSLKDMGIG